MPCKYNDKTRELMKATQETYTEKEKQFKEESQKKLEERLKVYD